MNRDLISIVIPVYNGEKFLRENVEGILAQTYKNLEIIYVCDGCTDHTIDILQDYRLRDSRLRIRIEQENQGAAAARNIGMTMARGDWMIFLDSDDLFVTDMIETMHTQAVKENADVCCCYWEKFDDKPGCDGHVRNLMFKQYCKTYPVIYVPDQQKNLLQLALISPCNKLINKKLYKKKEVYFQQLPNCDDAYYSFVVFAEAAKIVYVDKVLFYYRSNIGRRTLSTDQNEKKNYVFEAYDGFYQYISLRNNKELKQSFYNRVCGDMAVLYDTTLYRQLFYDLRNIYFNRWEMQGSDVLEQLSYFNREVYKKIYMDDLDLRRESLALRAKENFVRDVSMIGSCALWGCGYQGEKLLAALDSKNIEIGNVYDSDPNKWGKIVHGNMVKAFRECREASIIVTTALYYDEIKKQIGDRAVKVHNLEEEIFLIK